MSKLFKIFHESGPAPSNVKIIDYVATSGEAMMGMESGLQTLMAMINNAVRNEGYAVMLKSSDIPKDLLPSQAQDFHVDDKFEGMDLDRYFPAVVIITGQSMSTTNEDIARAYLKYVHDFTV